jgi:7-cyano-7-deazaguanine reductase
VAYNVRFTAPEFTSLCPMTGQPDFAHLVIDYVPGKWLVESKSLKLYPGASFRNHGAFHEDCTVSIARRLVELSRTAMAADRGLLVSARGHPDRRLLPDGADARGRLDPRPGRAALSRAGLKRKAPESSCEDSGARKFEKFSDA